MQLLISDTFTGTNSTSIESHAPNTNTPGHPWVIVNGNLQIQNNRIAQFQNQYNRAAIETGISDFFTSVILNDIGTAHDSFGGPLFRVVDNDKLLFFGMNGLTSTVLVKRDNGSYSIIATGSCPAWTPATDVTMSVFAQGTNLTCKINGVTSITFSTNFNQSATRHGFQGYFDGTGHYQQLYDNYQLYRFETLSAVAPLAGRSTLVATGSTVSKIDVDYRWLNGSLHGYDTSHIIQQFEKKAEGIYSPGNWILTGDSLTSDSTSDLTISTIELDYACNPSST